MSQNSSFQRTNFRGQMPLMTHECMDVCDCVLAAQARRYTIAHDEREGPLN